MREKYKMSRDQHCKEYLNAKKTITTAAKTAKQKMIHKLKAWQMMNRLSYMKKKLLLL